MNISKSLILLIFIAISIKSYSQPYFENRADIPEKYTWDLTVLFEDWNQWKSFYSETETLISQIIERDTFLSAPELYESLYSIDTISNRINKLSMFAMMHANVNQKDEFAANQNYKASVLNYKFRYKNAWLAPCLQNLNPDSVYKWINNYPKLKDYEFTYRADLRNKEHVIPKEKENTISLFDYAYYAFDDAYNALIDLDSDLPKITINDSVITLNTTKYFDILRNEKNREIRENAYNEISKKYYSNKNTIANILGGAANMNNAYAQAYNFKSTLAYHIDYDSIPIEFYSNLIDKVKKESKSLQKYHKLRAHAMKLSNYSPYDTKFSIAAPKVNYDIEMAKELIIQALKPMGDEYVSKITNLLNERKIDFFENKDKVTSMAYSISCFGTSPYILTAYGEDLKDVFDLIHELGHATHAIYSMDNQPINTYESTIFIDEITSTFNELLLTDYVLNHWEKKENKLYLLEIAIDNMIYYYKSAIKADFTLQVFNIIESDEDITASVLDHLYAKILTEFYGNSMNNIDSSGWCSYGILEFYDYQYVSSMTASLSYFDKIKNDSGNEWKNKYLTLLKSGGDDFPLNQLNKAGIDLMDKHNYSAIANYLYTLVEMYEQELKLNGLIH